MSIVWIARLVGAPIKDRIAGSDIFDALIAKHTTAKPLKVFMFGGVEGAAAAASRALNARQGGLRSVGALYPGFGSVEDMSRREIIDTVNSNNADFLVVSLGAKKGQLWLLRNHRRLVIPVRAHLGASVNFEAGTLKRAPLLMQKSGLEWLWRIKEEPYLWRRYWHDGRVLLLLLLTHILPLIIWMRWLHIKHKHDRQDLGITQTLDHKSVSVSLTGPAIARHVDSVIAVFGDAVATKKSIVIDFSGVTIVDTRFLGLLLVLKKEVDGNGTKLVFKGLSRRLKRMFHLHCLGYLLSSGENGSAH
jgi:N-acetylglucosaminyldiphosphoundecaprenol N-acetyl-beta-D-mannosaminyltransferase